jgi:hypothetical protein
MWCLWSIAFSFLPLGTIHPPKDVRLCSYIYKNCACFAIVETDVSINESSGRIVISLQRLQKVWKRSVVVYSSARTLRMNVRWLRLLL